MAFIPLFILFRIPVFLQLASHTVLRKNLRRQYLPSFPSNSHKNSKKRSVSMFLPSSTVKATSRTSSKSLPITICRCSAIATQLFLATSQAFIEMSLLCFVHIARVKGGTIPMLAIITSIAYNPQPASLALTMDALHE